MSTTIQEDDGFFDDYDIPTKDSLAEAIKIAKEMGFEATVWEGLLEFIAEDEKKPESSSG